MPSKELEVQGLGSRSLGLAAGMTMAGRKPARALVLDGLLRNQCPLANTTCPGCPAGPPLEGCWQEAGRRRILGRGVEGASAMGRG